MKKRVYIETTVVGYLTMRASGHVHLRSKQLSTRQWWARERARYRLCTSQTVVAEAAAGDPAAAASRLNKLRGIAILESTQQVFELAHALSEALHLPQRAKADAVHMAVAAFHGVDYLLTWNCTHLANPAMARTIGSTCESFSCTSPLILTPAQLMEIR